MSAAPAPQTNPGQDLCQNLSRLPKPLDDQQVQAIKSYLQSGTQKDTYDTDYKSVDLGIGEKQSVTATVTGHGNNTGDQLEQFNTETQRHAFEFVKSDVQIELELDQPRKWIYIKGIEKRKFLHYQLYAAFWILLRERGVCRGLIEADRMGLGKVRSSPAPLKTLTCLMQTTIAILYIYLNYCLAENARHIQDFSGEHNGKGDRCQHPDKWPIVCACEPKGVTKRLGLRPIEGASLLLLPKSLLPIWKEEFVEFGFSDKVKLEFFIQHGDFPQDRVNALHRFQLQLRQVHEEGQHQASDRQSKPEWEVKEGTAPHRTVVATTVDSYWTKVQAHFQSSRTFLLSSGSAKGSVDHTDGLAWARVICDEAHLRGYKWHTQFYRIMTSLKHNDWRTPFFLAITGTPMRESVADMLGLIGVINMLSPDIGQNSDYKAFATEQKLYLIAELEKEARCESNPASLKKKHLEQKVAALMRAYTIQRKEQTIQNSKAIARLPPLECYDVSCESTIPDKLFLIEQVENALKQKWKVKIEKQRAAGEDYEELMDEEDLLKNANKPRIIATVPGLAGYPLAHLTFRHISGRNWHEEPERSKIYDNIGVLEKSSGKLQKLRTILSSIGTDIKGDPEKLVVVTEFPIICLVVWSVSLRPTIFNWD